MLRLSLAIGLLLFPLVLRAAEPTDFGKLPPNTWVKLSPLENTPPSPRLGYEGACVWDARHELLIRYGGHNQGGGGEQGSEIWTFDPRTARWQLKETNTSPPGICCGQQNIFDPLVQRYVRFPAFSASHGWQWLREVYLNDSSVWTYDLATNTWRNMRPLPAARPRPLRCASWDSEHGVTVMFGGEGSSEGTWTYDVWSNEWKKMNPKSEPEGRSGGNMAYDSKHKVHVLFGSQFNNDEHTWIYDLSNNVWRDAQPPAMPPTDKNDPVLTYDPAAQRVLAIMKITEGKDDDAKNQLETWAYDVAANRWSKLKPERDPDPTSSRARQLMFAPQLGVSLLENRPSNSRGPSEQQIWAYRFANSEAQPVQTPAKRETLRAIDRLVVSVLDEKQVEIAWPKLEGAAGYIVERAPVTVWTDDQLRRIKAQTPPLESPSVAAIRWIGKFAPVTKTPAKEAKFTDDSVDLSKPVTEEKEGTFERKFPSEEVDADGRTYRHGVYAYRVRAVDAAGKPGGYSPAVLTIPSSPEQLFSREEGTACHLKWQTNPERGIVGYRVYRMDGRYSKDMIPRLTSEPTRDLIFTDREAGKATRRYHVVAVDALGQEGFPSAPVWFEREWKQFYKPFTGEWHQ